MAGHHWMTRDHSFQMLESSAELAGALSLQANSIRFQTALFESNRKLALSPGLMDQRMDNSRGWLEWSAESVSSGSGTRESLTQRGGSHRAHARNVG